MKAPQSTYQPRWGRLKPIDAGRSEVQPDRGPCEEARWLSHGPRRSRDVAPGRHPDLLIHAPWTRGLLVGEGDRLLDGDALLALVDPLIVRDVLGEVEG